MKGHGGVDSHLVTLPSWSFMFLVERRLDAMFRLPEPWFHDVVAAANRELTRGLCAFEDHHRGAGVAELDTGGLPALRTRLPQLTQDALVVDWRSGQSKLAILPLDRRHPDDH